MEVKPFPTQIRFSLTVEESLQLASLGMILSNVNIADPKFFKHELISAYQEQLKGSTFDQIKEFSRVSNEYGTILLKGLPIDPVLPSTPPDGDRPINKLSFSESIMVLIGSMMGEVFSYIDEKKGLIIQNICPVKGKEQTQENVGSDFLEFHTEDSFHPFPPDLLMLICLRGDRTGKALTITASIERVIKLLSKNSIELLSQPNYTIRASTSFRDSKYVKNVSILSYENGSVNMIFDPSGMTCDDAKCAEAMEELYALLQCESYGACLQPGEAIIINNKKACHARTHFTPFYDGRDRWLQRVFLTKQLPNLKGLFVPGTRMLKRL